MTASAWWASLARFGMRPGLDRIAALMDRLDHPERAFGAVHVAGTNGKGSTSALIAEGLAAAGLAVGLTTSPDLGEERERVRIAGRLVPAELWAQAREVVEWAARTLAEPPTLFEAQIAAAFWCFREARVDAAVVEVGLGGRYDATNILPPPWVTVLTPVARDHEAVLGNTLEAIARDKTGVLKPGSRLVTAPQAPPVRRVVVEAARAVGIPVRWARPQEVTSDADGVSAVVDGRRVRTRLLGRHQAVNLATAWLALDWLAERAGLDRDALAHGVAQARWPGRLERVDGEPPVVLDAAHNLHGARALAHALAEPHLARPWELVFGVLDDKPGPAMVRVLAPRVRRIVLTRPASARAQDPAVIAAAGPYGRPVTVEPDWSAALDQALAAAGPHGAVLVAGSTYLVGPVRRRLVGSGGVEG
ncbi:MAG: bifunctional folylpolyglutamate synthase/dihydrofolate synthase [Actinomycetia bacterium]|nr:bifunctional folylpolyglutamate synthase/dihydrofolate synthase [Actinomycetes bacterium]